jgi:hypothetical protein
MRMKAPLRAFVESSSSYGDRPCQIVGHDWDILLFLSPFAVLGCDRCGERQSKFPESASEELLE